jgi:hypothetical protein
MGSPKRRIRAVPASQADEPADLQARLSSLEAEAADLRAEVAALHADLLWLAGVDDETGEAPGFLSSGWLAAGWVRASCSWPPSGLVPSQSSSPHLLDPSSARI